MIKRDLNIGFISFRFAGTDGVSLEAAKWAKVLEEMGCTCYYLAGETDTPPERTYNHDLFHFKTQAIKEVYEDCFNLSVRPISLTNRLHELRNQIKHHIYEFVRKFEIDLLIPQNAITIPLNVPLGMALTEYIAESGIPVISHHHDFFWERKRFLRNCIWDYINSCYPPHLPNIQHVVINTSAQNQLALRTGISSVLMPNVMNFENPPTPPDDYTKSVRKDLGVGEEEILILQPTRVVQRKGIEHALELVARLDMNAVLVISHASGDEGYEYEERVKEYARLLGARALFVDEIIGEERGTTPDGKKIYTLDDIYPYADLVTYPSLVEGFGNAFLETVWFKRPIMVNNYSIYSTDIRPKGFQVIEMDNFISQKTIDETKRILSNKKMAQNAADINYELGLKFYSYKVIRQNLSAMIAHFFGSH